MPLKRPTFILATIIISFTLLITYNTNIHRKSWEDLSQHVGMGEWASAHGNPNALSQSGRPPPRVEFRPGKTKPPGYKYTKTLVIPKTKKEDTSWMDTELPDVDKAIYVADDPKAPLHPPKNKGHEVMIYLTYIIDHYDKLPDVSIFMHAHMIAWHNADLFGLRAGDMVRRLSPERVTREGFMNLRCQWEPGCPDWMHPGETEENVERPEEVLIAKAWAELFPLDPVPDLLASPCCSQFAISRDRILSIPLSTYIFYRDWLLKTRLKDFVSGRVWEYLWQYVFTGHAYFCPVEHICYCDGFGLCFGGKAEYEEWWNLRIQRDLWNSEWLEWEEAGRKIQELNDEGRYQEAEALDKPEPGKDIFYNGKITDIQKQMDDKLNDAMKRGENPKLRAEESGREWHEGDGF